MLLYHNPSRGALLDLVLTSAPPRDESDARHPGLCVNATPGGLHLRVYEPLVWRLKAFAGKLSGKLQRRLRDKHRLCGDRRYDGRGRTESRGQGSVHGPRTPPPLIPRCPSNV